MCESLGLGSETKFCLHLCSENHVSPMFGLSERLIVV